MPEYTLRMASVDDAPQLAEFNRAMAHETEGIGLDPGTVDSGVQAMFDESGRGFYVVADAGDRLAGSLMITYEWSDWRDGMFWWIQSVYVRPEFRRRGVYRSLYRFVHDMAEGEPDVCGFRLYVERDNDRAQQTYGSLGMTRTPYLVYESLTRRKGAEGRS